eukprot:CAMPEP_0183596692 /NCGR_PEP_ID=MMETSP0371-20130417/175593_1 /TAXON_ID=268820 /ORGANISM="Peridinium aciculiferum, Strain PAER-2" /LENGTH=194 /DNA_ID=CAMNT_0025808591 /DNA_START=23 /DNA_END=605 /DNA_ORIENTATION=+
MNAPRSLHNLKFHELSLERHGPHTRRPPLDAFSFIEAHHECCAFLVRGRPPGLVTGVLGHEAVAETLVPGLEIFFCLNYVGRRVSREGGHELEGSRNPVKPAQLLSGGFGHIVAGAQIHQRFDELVVIYDAIASCIDLRENFLHARAVVFVPEQALKSSTEITPDLSTSKRLKASLIKLSCERNLRWQAAAKNS